MWPRAKREGQGQVAGLRGELGSGLSIQFRVLMLLLDVAEYTMQASVFLATAV